MKHSIQSQCGEQMDRFFASYRDPAMQRATMKAVRFLAAGDVPMGGKPEGWAAGIAYFMANREERACGVPGILNADLEYAPCEPRG